MNANEIQIPYDKQHKKSHQNTQFCQIWSDIKISNNTAKYEVLIKQYLCSILDISARDYTCVSLDGMTLFKLCRIGVTEKNIQGKNFEIWKVEIIH